MSESAEFPAHSRPDAWSSRPVRALPIAALTFVCSLGTGVLWNAIFFIAESEYGFSQNETLLLAFVNGVCYAAVAMFAGPAVRLLERRLSPRAALGAVLLAQALLAPLVKLAPGIATLWFSAVVMTALGALQWPIVQHYLVSGRHGREMRDAIGWWNVSWMAATAVSLAAAGPLKAAGLISWAIPSLLPINLIAILFLAWFPKVPARHDGDEQARSVPATYAPLLAASRVLHPLGYLVIGALAPILPYIFDTLGTESALQAPVGSTWHVARVAAVVVLWRTAFWHGRGASLATAALLLAGGFALAVGARSEGVLVVGLACLGAGQGVIYYSAIYYGLAVGGAKVDAGGIHEALVGAGYFLGPMLGLVTFSLGFGTGSFIGVVLGALAVGFAASLVRAGRERSQRIA